MKKLLLTVVLSLLAVSGFAHQMNCEYVVQGDFAFKSGDLHFFSKDNDSSVEINRIDHLYIDGNRQSLDDQQQKLVSEYAEQVRVLVPLVFDLVVEGSEIGVDAATLALTTLFENEDVDALLDSMEEIRSDLIGKIDPNNFSTQDFDGGDLDQQIDTTVKRALVTLLPEVASMVVSSILTGDGELSQLAERAEKLEKLIEKHVEARADELETKAESLCKRLERMDEVESRLARLNLERIDFIEGV